MTWSRNSNCITEEATEMPRCFSISIQSEVAWRALFLALTVPAIWIAPENSSSFSVSVVLPASGWEMMPKVRRRSTSRAISAGVLPLAAGLPASGAPSLLSGIVLSVSLTMCARSSGVSANPRLYRHLARPLELFLGPRSPALPLLSLDPTPADPVRVDRLAFAQVGVLGGAGGQRGDHLQRAVLQPHDDEADRRR